MTEIDSRFGRQVYANDSAKELTHASDEAFNEMTKDLRKSFSESYAFSEQMSDKCTTFASWICPELARKHSQELEVTAHQAFEKGNIDAAKHLLKRNIAFTANAFGYDDEQANSLRTQLTNLSAQSDSKSAHSDSKTVQPNFQGGINKFEDLFKRR